MTGQTESDNVRAMQLNLPEQKLILRLRQLRGQHPNCLVLINPMPLAMSVLGKMEFVEVVGSSGSVIMWGDQQEAVAKM